MFSRFINRMSGVSNFTKGVLTGVAINRGYNYVYENYRGNCEDTFIQRKMKEFDQKGDKNGETSIGEVIDGIKDEFNELMKRSYGYSQSETNDSANNEMPNNEDIPQNNDNGH